MSKKDEKQAQEQEQEQAIFSIEKLYVKDLSLEVPHAPRIFLEATEPEVEMSIATDSQKLEDEFYEVTVTVKVEAKLADGRYMFLNKVTQGGIFRLVNIPEDDLNLLLAVACPNILFPYVRETVSAEVSRAGFPPVLLSPINFEAMYHQAQEGNA